MSSISWGKLAIFLILVGVIGAAAIYSSGSGGTNFIEEDGLNVVIISVEPVRSDHMGVYGYERNTTPNIDRLAQDSYVFENVYSTSTWTLPSMGSVFSSNYPTVHGATTKEEDNFDPVGPTLAETFRDKGYRTGAFVGSGFVSPRFGIDKGFDIYDEGVVSVNSPVKGLHFEESIPKAVEWTDKSEEPFFLYLQSFDPHAPFHSPEPFNNRYAGNYSGSLSNYTLDYRSQEGNILDDIYYTSDGPVLRTNNTALELDQQDIQYIRDRYDEGILYSDHMVGEFLNRLREKELMNETVVIFMSAHGETLADRKRMDSRLIGRFGPYEEVVRTPLMIRVPHKEGRQVEDKLSLIDLMPTLVEAAGIKDNSLSSTMQGESFAEVFRGESVGREKVFFEYNVRSIVGGSTDQWKYFSREGRSDDKLFNLVEDPSETADMSSEKDQVVNEFQESIDALNLRNSQIEGSR